jgi:hypothetical protein
MYAYTRGAVEGASILKAAYDALAKSRCLSICLSV